MNSVIQQQSDPQAADRFKTYDWKNVIDNSIVDKLGERRLLRDALRRQHPRRTGTKGVSCIWKVTAI
ncbi:MAG: hypothetical protein WDO18_09960 [Acidobacteriota bacterium]